MLQQQSEFESQAATFQPDPVLNNIIVINVLKTYYKFVHGFGEQFK